MFKEALRTGFFEFQVCFTYAAGDLHWHIVLWKYLLCGIHC